MTDHVVNIVANFRRLADFLEDHPDLAERVGSQTINVIVRKKEELAAFARYGGWQKEHCGSFFVLRKQFGEDLQLDVFIDRETVCERRVVGKKVVPAKPAVEEHEEDVVEWVCGGSLLELRPGDVA